MTESNLPLRHLRRKREAASFWQCAILFGLILLCFSPLLLTSELWSEYDPATQSGFHETAKWSDAWTVQKIRKHDPISLSSYHLEALAQNPAIVHRVINISLHCIAVWLFWYFLRKIRLRHTWLAVLIFALHPSVIPVLFWPGFRHVILGFIIMLGALNLAAGSLNPWRYLALLALSTIGLFIHINLIFLPAIFALLTYCKEHPPQLSQYNWILPILCINLFLGVWLLGQNNSGSSVFVLSEWSYAGGHNMQYLLKKSFLPTDLDFFKALPNNSGYALNSGINLAPFLLSVPFLLLGILNRGHHWARNLLLGVISYTLLIIPVIFIRANFINGMPAYELFNYYPALAALCASSVLIVVKLSTKLGILAEMMRNLVLYVIVGILFILSFSHALEVKTPTDLWHSISKQWPNSTEAKIAYLKSILRYQHEDTNKDTLILMMQSILEEEPERIEIRKMLARTMRDANQRNNALREFRYILREETNDRLFLEEAANFLESCNLKFEANKIRQRKPYLDLKTEAVE
ncbi:MAG: Uncharacterised protein [Opitutia bacterium UBA7350]|nr:MAG: Uncharacterised protein [Opitutae bacterium UBA7350]